MRQKSKKYPPGRRTDTQNNKDVEIFRVRFCELLKSSGKTQAELAEYLNVAKQCVSDYKSGKSIPSLPTFKKICEFFAVSADYLLGLSNY